MRFGIPEEEKKDRRYWGQPLWFRIYMRVFYALFGFIATGSFFDLYTPAPLWLQIFLGASVGLAVMLFRVAYPNGFSGFQEWIMEAMAEAQEDAESKGLPYKAASSQEIRDALDAQRKLNREQGKSTGMPWGRGEQKQDATTKSEGNSNGGNRKTNKKNNKSKKKR